MSVDNDYYARQERFRNVLAAMGWKIPADQHIVAFVGVAMTSDTRDVVNDGHCEITPTCICVVPKDQAESTAFEKFVLGIAKDTIESELTPPD